MKKLLFLLLLLPMLGFGQAYEAQSKTPATGANAGNQYYQYYGLNANGYLIIPTFTNATANRSTPINGQFGFQTSDSTGRVYWNGTWLPLGGGGSSSAYYSSQYFYGLATYANPLKVKNSDSLAHQGLSYFQPTLVSGTNIKTLNGNSLLGSGNIVVSGSNIYNSNGSLTGNRTLDFSNHALTFTGGGASTPIQSFLELGDNLVGQDDYAIMGVDNGNIGSSGQRFEVQTIDTNAFIGLRDDGSGSQVGLTIDASANLTIQDELGNHGLFYEGTYFSSDAHWLTPKRYVDSLVSHSGGVTSFNTRTGVVTLSSSDVTTALTFTPYNATNPSNYIARTGISATSPVLYNNSTGVVSIQQASGSQPGYLSSTDWTTFNGKQAALSGTGFVKISGTTISYDNSTYLTTAVAASTYVSLSGSYSNPSWLTGVPYSILTGTVPTWNQNTTGTAANITATSNSTITTLSALSLPYSQITGTPSLSGYEVTSNKTATASTSTTTYPNWLGVENYVTSVLPAAITASNGVIRTVNNLTSDTTYNRSVSNSYTLAALQTKFNNYLLSSTASSTYVAKTTTVAGFALSSNVTLATETYSTGLISGSYNGGTAATVKADTTVLQTVLNLFPKADTRYYKASNPSGYITNSVTTLPSLSLPYSQLTGTPSLSAYLTASNFITSETPSGSINGSNTSFTAANSPVTGTIKMFWNGVRTTKFTATGASITTLFVANTGDTILIDYQK